jgi:hypothetical protein
MKMLSNLLQKGLLLGALIGFALVILGWILVPTTNLLSVIAACLVLGIYGFVYYFGVPRIRPEILRWASIFGLADRMRSGMLSAILSAMISALIWLIAIGFCSAR